MTTTQDSTKMKETKKKGWLKRFFERLAEANQQKPPSC
jgi:hypothetical protein